MQRSGTVATAPTGEEALARVTAILDEAQVEIETHVRALAFSELGVPLPAAIPAYLASAPRAEEDPVRMLAVIGTLQAGDATSQEMARTLEARRRAVAQMRADWLRAAMIRHGDGQLAAWADAPPGDGAGEDQRLWWETVRAVGSDELHEVRSWLARLTEANGGPGMASYVAACRRSGADQRAAQRDQKAGGRLAGMMSDLLLDGHDDAVAVAAHGIADQMLGVSPPDERYGLDDARRLAQAYADADRPAPHDMLQPWTVTRQTLIEHGHERSAGAAAVAREDERERNQPRTAGMAAHALLRALEDGRMAAVTLAEDEVGPFLERHGRHITSATVEPRRDAGTWQALAVFKLEADINGVPHGAWVRVPLGEPATDDPDIEWGFVMREAAERWQESMAGGPGAAIADADMSMLAHGERVELLPASPVRPAISAEAMVGVEPCAHPHADWENNRSNDAKVLCCPDCGARHLAVVPLHRVPGAKIRGAAQYMARECFYAALRGDTPRALNLAALRRADGEASMDPAVHLAPAYEFPSEMDIASAMFG